MSKIINTSKITSNYELPDGSKKSSEVISNESKVEIMSTFTALRTSDVEFAIPAQEITQSLTLTNGSDVAVKNVKITDNIGKGATFVAGSVKVDGAIKADADPTIGITLDTPIEPNTSAVLSYTLAVDSAPNVDEFSTFSQVTYDTDDSTGLSITSNVVNVEIVMEKLTATKTSDVSAVISGQKITYQIIVKNEGNIENTDITLTDPLPNQVTFVTDSVTIDDVKMAGYDPRNGIKLKDLSPNSETVVKFEVTVNNV